MKKDFVHFWKWRIFPKIFLHIFFGEKNFCSYTWLGSGLL